MVAPNTGSLIGPNDADNTAGNRTGTAVSTNIIIEVDGNAVGAVRSLSIDERRAIAMINEVGTDGHIDSVPRSSTDITGTCERVRFDNLRIAPAFSRGFLHASAQRLPFDIVVKDIFAGNDPRTTIVTTIKNVWISQISVRYQSDDFVVVETMNWEAETLFSTLGANTNAVPAAAGGRNLPIRAPSPFELEADRGERRGALDGAGLLLAISEAL